MRYVIPFLALMLSFSYIIETHAAARMSPFQKGAATYFNISNNVQKRTNVRSYYSRQRRSNYLKVRQQTTPKESLHLASPVNRSGLRKRSLSPKAPIVPIKITREDFKTVRADKIPFYFSIPSSLEKISDDLTWNQGHLKFKNSKSTVEVFSTGQSCEGGPTYTQDCFLTKAKILNENLKTSHPNTKVREDKSTYLQHSTIRPNENDLARSLILENKSEKIYQFIFTDPINNFLWGLKVTAENNANVPLSQTSNHRRMTFSLFQKSSPKKQRASRAPLKLSERKIFNYSQITSQRPAIKKLEKNNQFKAKNIPFEIKLPEGFEIKNDSLSFEKGEMLFKNTSTNGTIRITSTNQKCNYDTSTLVRRCIEKASKERSDILWFETPDVQFLQEENILFKSTFSQKTNNIGRFFMARVDKKRIGLFTFTDPIHKNVWTIEMESPETKKSFLNDMRQIRKLITSIYFKK